MKTELNRVTPFKFITHSAKATSILLVSEKWLSEEPTRPTHLLSKCTVCVSALTKIDNVMARRVAGKVLRRNIF